MTDYQTIAASAAAVVHPEKETHPDCVVEIKIDDAGVRMLSPKDETLRQLVRGMGFRWTGGSWRLKIDTFTGSAMDRAAELGNTCLLSGFPVRIYDADLRRKAIEADFEPRCHRWVSIRVGGKYDGWLALRFERGNEDLYQACRKLPGSRWDSPNVVVRVEQYAQVEDFAALWDFRFSPGALDAITAYKAGETTAPVAVKKPKKAAEIAPEDKLRAIMDSSRNVLEDLMDDD